MSWLKECRGRLRHSSLISEVQETNCFGLAHKTASKSDTPYSQLDSTISSRNGQVFPLPRRVGRASDCGPLPVVAFPGSISVPAFSTAPHGAAPPPIRSRTQPWPPGTGPDDIGQAPDCSKPQRLLDRPRSSRPPSKPEAATLFIESVMGTDSRAIFGLFGRIYTAKTKAPISAAWTTKMMATKTTKPRMTLTIV